MPNNNIRHSLVRAWSTDMRHNFGNVAVAEILRRNVDAPVHHTVGGWQSYPLGAVLIDADAALGPIARAIGKIAMLITIRDTTEFLWWPVAAHLAAGDYWTVELVPYAEFLRNTSVPDAEILRKAHDDNPR